MKFLTKFRESEILDEGLEYNINQDNSRLRLKLLDEQKNFCAYTEKYISKIDSTEVEHFNPSLKGQDNYYNYYTTLRYANEQKISKYNFYKHCTFFQDLFFQNPAQLNNRIQYKEFVYDVLSETDQDAKDFIDYLGFNDDYLFVERLNHINRLKLTLSTFTDIEKIEYFRLHRNDLSFITAIEYEFQMDLSELIND